MKNLGIYRTKDGKLYHLIFFPNKRLGQAIGPLPERVGSASVAKEVYASSDSEAKELLIEKLAGIEVKGPTFLTTTKATSGETRVSSTTLPPEVVKAAPEFVISNASKLIVQDNPELKPIEQIVAQHVRPLLSGVSLEEKIDPEAARKADKVEINITYAPKLYIGRDAYLGEHVDSMGPTIQNLNLFVSQTWNDIQSNYEIDAVEKDLRKLAEKIESIEDQVDNLQDVAVIEKAANEMHEGRGTKALRLLSVVSKAVLDVSREIGTDIATELIMKMTGLK